MEGHACTGLIALRYPRSKCTDPPPPPPVPLAHLRRGRPHRRIIARSRSGLGWHHLSPSSCMSEMRVRWPCGLKERGGGSFDASHLSFLARPSSPAYSSPPCCRSGGGNGDGPPRSSPLLDLKLKMRIVGRAYQYVRAVGTVHSATTHEPLELELVFQPFKAGRAISQRGASWLIHVRPRTTGGVTWGKLPRWRRSSLLGPISSEEHAR